MPADEGHLAPLLFFLFMLLLSVKQHGIHPCRMPFAISKASGKEPDEEMYSAIPSSWHHGLDDCLTTSTKPSINDQRAGLFTVSKVFLIWPTCLESESNEMSAPKADTLRCHREMQMGRTSVLVHSILDKFLIRRILKA